MTSRPTLVTGGAGYIGSHVVHALRDSGREAVVVDNLVTGSRQAVPDGVPFHNADVSDIEAVAKIIKEHDIGAVLHFAGSVVVPESIEDPIKYYRNNTQASLALIEACVRHDIDKFIFSSTAAVYGFVDVPAVTEDMPTAPISPYGSSKLMTEQQLADVARAYPWFRVIRLRYFNVAGADPKGRTGQQGPQSTHLIRVAIDTALGRRDELPIFGDDYDTRDGTCERDYIHVWDLAQAHIAALDHLEAGGEGGVFNCGYGRGITVREVIATVERLTGEPLSTRMAGRRPGDPARVIADSEKIKRVLDWTPSHTDITEIIGSALRWQQFLGDRKVSAG